MREFRRTHGIAAVSSRCATTFIFGDLHETLLASTSDGVGIAGAFLHGERSQHDCREAKLFTVLLKQVDILCARQERSFPGTNGGRKRDRNNISNLDEGGPPATISEAAVQPVDAPVRSAGGGGLLCKTRQHFSMCFG